MGHASGEVHLRTSKAVGVLAHMQHMRTTAWLDTLMLLDSTQERGRDCCAHGDHSCTGDKRKAIAKSVLRNCECASGMLHTCYGEAQRGPKRDAEPGEWAGRA